MLELTAMDRCDGCSARAAHVARKNGDELMFCNHHMEQHREALLDKLWLIISDESPAEPVPASAYHEG